MTQHKNWLPAWECFIRVAAAASMASAARELGCTRAQVSKQMAELERSFGVRLFDRSTRRISLTPAGEVFQQHALRTLEAIAGTEVALSNLGDAPYGTLRVSATVSFGRRCIAPLLPGLLANHPDLDCELILTDSVVDLVGDNIDLALRMTRLPPEDAVARRILSLRRVICASPAYLERHGEPTDPQALPHHQCFSTVLRDDHIWLLRDAIGREIRIPISSRLNFNNVEAIYDAVLAGHGIAILPTYLCHPELARGELRALLKAYEPTTVFGSELYACYTPSRVRVAKVKVFLDALQGHFSTALPWDRT
ncbi:MAG: LysR family transcriptional regulator [Zoogloeaceae bacterium]|nr:LysR family transcriptional regulator [Zoogloeaceae bacterium]